MQLQSIDDEGLADEISVIWDIESGTQIHERAALPDPTGGFDPARRLDSIHWGAVASADVRTLRTPFRSSITIDDYQFDPVAQVPEWMAAKSRLAKRG